MISIKFGPIGCDRLLQVWNNKILSLVLYKGWPRPFNRVHRLIKVTCDIFEILPSDRLIKDGHLLIRCCLIKVRLYEKKKTNLNSSLLFGSYVTLRRPRRCMPFYKDCFCLIIPIYWKYILWLIQILWMKF